MGMTTATFNNTTPSALWGDTFLQGSQLEDGRFVLNVVLTSLAPSSLTVSWRGYPLSTCTDGTGNFVLAVIEDSTGMISADIRVTLKQTSYAVAQTDAGSTLPVRIVSGSTTIVGTTRFRGMPLAYNATNTMLMAAVTPSSIDEQQTLYVKGQPFVVQRSGTSWYLVVSTTTSLETDNS
jgi:hypothetical protein